MTQNEQDVVELAVILLNGLHSRMRAEELAKGLKQAAQRVSAERNKT